MGRGGTGDIYWTMSVLNCAARQEEKRKTIEKVHGCTEGHAEIWCDKTECSR